MSTPQDQVSAQLKRLGIDVPEGWAALDPTSPKNLEARERSAHDRYVKAKIIADGISTEALLALEELTTDAPTWQVAELGLLNAIGFGILREGMNSVTRYIKQQKAIAAAGPGGDVKMAPKRRK